MKEFAFSIYGTPIPAPGVPQFKGGGDALGQILGLAMSFLFLGAVLIGLGYIIWGSIDFITSRGEKEKRHSARRKITYSVIGMAVIFLSYLFIKRSLLSIL